MNTSHFEPLSPRLVPAQSFAILRRIWLEFGSAAKKANDLSQNRGIHNHFPARPLRCLLSTMSNPCANLSILLMEEHELSRFAAAELLRDAGFTVTEASDETHMLHLLHKQRFDVLIMAMLAPRHGSFGLLIWARLKWPDMRVIVATHLSRAEIEKIMFGEVEFMSKPLHARELISLITRLVPKKDITYQ